MIAFYYSNGEIICPDEIIAWEEEGFLRIGRVEEHKSYNGGMMVKGRSIADIIDCAKQTVRVKFPATEGS